MAGNIVATSTNTGSNGAKVINFGSINIDHVYRVPHFVQPGETLNSLDLTTVLGGKGANQSVALAKAGVQVAHIGRVSRTDAWAVDSLIEMGVGVQHVALIDEPSGHAIIQVDDAGENSIVLHGGANQSFTQATLEKILLDKNNAAGYLLIQNECNLLTESIALARSAGLKVALNPAPMSESIKSLTFSDIDLLIVNQLEAESLTGKTEREGTIRALSALAPDTQVVLTLGASGAVLLHQGRCIEASSPAVNVVDTTGAGDTFVGYFLAGCVSGMDGGVALERACKAASIAVTKQGATPSIPSASTVDG